MILRGIEVERWRCIRKLRLSDLPLGIVVLHGPNRTGKSSLVRAIRACLYDFDPGSTSQELRKNHSWNSSEPPRVTVEFESGGQNYRITKVFSPRSDGMARLETKAGDAWKSIENAPREASRRCRELLGADQQKSDSGLNQLLWLEQGAIALPERDRLDATLEQRLMDVLGVLVTGRDLAFKRALDARWGRWFTPKGRDQKSSPLLEAQSEHKRRNQVRDEEEGKFRAMEQLIAELQRCEDSLPQLRKAAESAGTELQKLAQKREQTLERRRLFQQAEQEHKFATQKLEAAESRLKAFLEARVRCQECEAVLAETEAIAKAAEEQQAIALNDHGVKTALKQQTRLAEERILQTRADIDERRKLLELATRRQRLGLVREELRKLEAEQAELEKKQKSASVPDAKDLGELRGNRQRAAELRAKMEAVRLTLKVIPVSGMKLHLGLDQEPAARIELPAGEEGNWSLRQRAVLELPGLCRIELGRAQADLDLERTADELHRLDQFFRKTLESFRQDPDDPAGLDRLHELRIRKETWLEQLQKLRQQMQEKAPHGLASLEAEVADVDRMRRFIIESRPDLEAWPPDALGFEKREKEFIDRAAHCKEQRLAAEQSEQEALRTVQRHTVMAQQKRDKLIELRAKAIAGREELERLGEEPALRDAVDSARSFLASTQERLAGAALTEEELSIEQSYGDAKSAWELRQERLRKCEDDRLTLRGQLQSSEGLHTRRADAEAALGESVQKLERERLEADAHEHLRQLFDQCREQQVQHVVGPIGRKVLDWAQHVGLQYREMCFGEGFLPDGFVPNEGDNDKPVPLSEESYGTDEQLSLLVRLAIGGILAQQEPVTAILDDPLAHADPVKHRRILDVLRLATTPNVAQTLPGGKMQIIILTCHPDRFDSLSEAHHVDLARLMQGSD
jgi:hypothetical protein